MGSYAAYQAGQVNSLKKELHDAQTKIKGLERKAKLSYDEVWEEAINAAIGVLDSSETEPDIDHYERLDWSRNQLKKMRKK